MEMKKYNLSEILTIKNGKDHKELKSGIYPVFGSGGIMRHVDTFLYDKPSILLPRKGTLDNIQYSDKPFWTVDTLYYTEVNFGLANPFYLYNFIKLLDLSNLDSGTGVPSMTFDSYYNLSVNLPSLPTQQKIAAVLSSLDDKIALNKKINAKLEAMAKRLYDYWFVQFDYPDKNGKPYKTSGGKMVLNEVLKREIPEGWEVKKLGDVISTSCERINTNDIENQYYVPIEVIPRNKMSFHETANLDKAATGLCSFKKRSILLSNRRVYFHKVCISPFDGITRDTVIIINPKQQENLGFVYQIVNSNHFIDYATVHSYGSEQPVLSTPAVLNYKIIHPNRDLDKEYSRKTESIISQVLQNELEIQKLTKLRDRLLPLLMNGQVVIK